MIQKLALTMFVALAIAACHTSTAIVSATPSEQSLGDAPPQGVAACYVRRDSGWEPAGDDFDERACHRFFASECRPSSDSDFGCYKWSMGADAPALPWRVAGSLPQAAADTPPLTHGLYRIDGEYCDLCVLGRWRARGQTPILARPIAGARVIGTTTDMEWVTAFEQFAMITPLRGTVLRNEDLGFNFLRAGDIVYFVRDSGYDDPVAMVWRRGEEIEIRMDDPALVRWDDRQTALENPRAGWWVRVRRANGQTGWVRDPGEANFDCMSNYDRPDFCQ